MVPFIIRRLLWMVVLLLVISFLTYVIFYTLPAADPAALRAGRQPTAELLASIRHTLGLDRPRYTWARSRSLRARGRIRAAATSSPTPDRSSPP